MAAQYLSMISGIAKHKQWYIHSSAKRSSREGPDQLTQVTEVSIHSFSHYQTRNKRVTIIKLTGLKTLRNPRGDIPRAILSFAQRFQRYWRLFAVRFHKVMQVRDSTKIQKRRLPQVFWFLQKFQVLTKLKKTRKVLRLVNSFLFSEKLCYNWPGCLAWNIIRPSSFGYNLDIYKAV